MAKFTVKDGKLDKVITLYVGDKDKGMTDYEKNYLEYESSQEEERLQKEEEMKNCSLMKLSKS